MTRSARRRTEERGPYEVGAFEQPGGRAGVADGAVVEEVRAVGELDRAVDRLLDDHDRGARRRAGPAAVAGALAVTSGARPRDSSSIRSRRGARDQRHASA